MSLDDFDRQDDDRADRDSINIKIDKVDETSTEREPRTTIVISDEIKALYRALPAALQADLLAEIVTLRRSDYVDILNCERRFRSKSLNGLDYIVTISGRLAITLLGVQKNRTVEIVEVALFRPCTPPDDSGGVPAFHPARPLGESGLAPGAASNRLALALRRRFPSYSLERMLHELERVEDARRAAAKPGKRPTVIVTHSGVMRITKAGCDFIERFEKMKRIPRQR